MRDSGELDSNNMAILYDTIRGLSDSKWSGIAGSVAECVGLDLHSTPGLLKVQQKLTKNSGATIDAFCRVSVAASTGYSFWFSFTSGKIWARSSTGTWTLAYTTVPAAGSSGCLGAFEYNGFIYWATQSRLHRVTIAGADDSWAAGAVTLDFATFSVTDSEFHPMAVQDGTLWIGDGNRIASVDDTGTFNNGSAEKGLDILTPHRIKCLKAFEQDIVFGTFIHASVAKASIIRWDCASPSWNSWDDVDEVGVNELIQDDNYLYAQCGRAGQFYLYNGEKLEPYKRLPGDWSPTKYGEVYPGSSARWKNIPIFGFSNSPESANSTGNPAKQGIYSLGSYSRDYPKVLDLTFVISEDVTSTIEIGAVLVSGLDVFAAWKNGSTYGVDRIDYTAKYASAYLETTMLYREKRDKLKTIGELFALYETLPSGTSLTFSYKKNHGSYVSMTSVTDSVLQKVRAELAIDSIGAFQAKLAFGVSSNDAPTVEAIGDNLESDE